MDLDKAVIIAGVGCRKGTGAGVIAATIDEALARAWLRREHVAVIATSKAKSKETGILRAAKELGCRLVLIDKADLSRAVDRTVTRSERVHALTGLASVAEAAALAAGGPAARLVLPRIVCGPATCALVATGSDL